jgi:electron transfer flavoprotein beta subunit
MNIVVPIKLVPDLVEELSIDESGVALDTTWMRMIINEFDDHAIEQAILLKEQGSGHVTVIAPEIEGVDDVLYTAAAKGADRLIKLTGNFEEERPNNHALARALAPLLEELQADLVLTGVQAHDDLDGSLGPLLAEYAAMPYVGYVANVTTNEATITASKEYPGGLIAVAQQPPRYVAISKIRQMMKTTTIEEREVPTLDSSGELSISRMFQPEAGERAEMIEGDEEEVAGRLVEILKELAVL